MTKSTYLRQTDVQEFIQWLAENLETSLFAHQYVDRRSKRQWQCASLFDAYKKYDWGFSAIPELEVEKGSSFEANHIALDAIQKELKQALGDADNEALLQAAKSLMAWGGVTNGNNKWLEINKELLVDTFTDTKEALHAGCVDHLTGALRFNAGFTKLYALICDDLIIYDSRVAAALGWLVVKYCQETQRSKVPELLRFPWAAAKEASTTVNPKNRCPKSGTLRFPGLRSGVHHAQWALRASWLLEKMLGMSDSSFNLLVPQVRLRAVEAALFMIGYDLGFDSEVERERHVFAVQAQEHTIQADVDEGWYECYTLARKNLFYYFLGATRIQTRNANNGAPVSFSYQDIRGILALLWADFRKDPFPLSNSADRVPAGLARNGLGVAYYAVTQSSPPASSRLAAILEESQIFIRNWEGRGLYWQLNTQLLDFDNLSVEQLMDVLLERD